MKQQEAARNVKEVEELQSSDRVGHEDNHEHEHALDWREINRVLFVAVAAAAIWFLSGRQNPYITGVGVICTLVGGFPIFHEAYENIVQRRMTMELSMAIAIVAALAIREIFTALVITLFVLVAEILEGLTVSRGRTAIRHLVGLLPTTATVRRNDKWQEVQTKQIAVGDIVLVKPGARIPVDGLVAGGHSFVDQATITGESMPVEKTKGSAVYAGTINQSGALEIRLDRMGRDTTFGKIIDAVERAEKSRAPIQGIADRLAGYLVYFALGAAVVTFLVTHNVRSTISVIIVAGACGIAAGTPLAILGGIGRSAQLGSIIKGGLYLESLATIDTILLDKTGTLTYGTPAVVDVHPATGVSVPSLLQASITAESRSEHPVAKAILKKASDMGIPIEEPEKFEYTPGKGSLRYETVSKSSQAIAFFWKAIGSSFEPPKPRTRIRKYSWPATATFSEPSVLPTRSGPKQRKRFKISNQWDSRRFFSPGTLVAWRKTSEESSVWTRSPLNCCPKISWNM